MVPAYLLQPTVITRDNHKQTLVDGGHYTQAQLG